MQTSPLVARRRTLAPPQLNAPPPTRGGGGSSRVNQQTRRSSPPPKRTPSPLLPASPLPGVDSGRIGAVQKGTPPRLPLNRGRRPGAQDRGQYSLSTWQPPLPRHAPSLANIVQGGAQASPLPAVMRQDFHALYQCSIVSGLRTRLIFRHQAGSHEVSISCCLIAPPANASAPADGQRRRCRRKRATTASVAGPTLPPPDTGLPRTSSAAQRDASSSTPPPIQAISSPDIAPPLAKKTRKRR